MSEVQNEAANGAAKTTRAPRPPRARATAAATPKRKRRTTKRRRVARRRSAPGTLREKIELLGALIKLANKL